MCRVVLPEELISTAGDWDPVARKLTVVPYRDRTWGWHNTSSERGPSGMFNLPSGAAEYNVVTWATPTIDIYFNEVCR